MITVKGLEYTPEDFWRRFGNCVLLMVDGTVVITTDMAGGHIHYKELTSGLYDQEITTTQKSVPYNQFCVAEYIADTGYFNVANEEGYLYAHYLKYRPARQQVGGLSNPRLSNPVHDQKVLSRAYSGYFVSLAEAAQHAQMTGRCAVSRSLALGTNHVFFNELAIGTYSVQGGTVVFDQIRDEFVDLMRKEEVCLW